MTTTTIEGDVGNNISGGRFEGDVTLVSVLGQVLRARMLDPEAVRHIAAAYVTTPQTGAARDALRARGAVVLTGEHGCGRRTTAVSLLAQFSDVAHTIVLDEETMRQPVHFERGHGYLLDLDESREPGAAVAPLVGEMVAQARTVPAPLAIRAGASTWSAVGAVTVPVVALTAPPPASVLRAHLSVLASPDAGDAWADREDIRARLSSPEDAVRMATIIAEVLRTGVPAEQQPTEALNAFANWSDALEAWFGSTAEHGARRALLLAIAALDEAPAAAVFHAAGALADLVGLPNEPQGIPLTGPDIAELVTKAEGRLHDGNVGFFRPRYSEAVLDHVWVKRPHMRRVLAQWLIDLPGSEDSARAARSLTALAVRQADPELVCRAAAAWATAPRTRPLAVDALTTAAISAELGRDVRRQMYDWASKPNAAEGLHLAVAEVCSGFLAQAFPQIALTRLRHLVIRSDERVRDAAIDALATLAHDRRLRGPVLSELTDWLRGEDPRRSKTGPAFLRLAALRRDGRVVLLDDHSPDDVAPLAELWRHILRESPGGPPAPAADWLDAARTGLAPSEAVAEVLARTCRTNIDLGNLRTLLLSWAAPHDQPPPEVGGLVREVLERAATHLRTHLTGTEAEA